MKKILCILLVVALLAAVMCVPAFAAEEVNITIDGVELPPLPSGVDYSVFKYAFICESSAFYTLYLFDSLSDFYNYSLQSSGYVRCWLGGDGSYRYFRLDKGNTKWSDLGTVRYSSSSFSYYVIWSSFDICDLITGEKIFDGSTAVVDGDIPIPDGLNNLTDKNLNIAVNGTYFPELPISLVSEEYPNIIVFFDGYFFNYYSFDSDVSFSYVDTLDNGCIKIKQVSDFSPIKSYLNGSEYSANEQSLLFSKGSTVNVLASSFDIYDAVTGDLIVAKSEMFTTDGRVYPTDFQIRLVFHDTVDSIGATLNTGLSMVATTAHTVATNPLLLITVTLGFVGLSVLLFKRLR